MTSRLRKYLDERANIWSKMTEIMARSTDDSPLSAEDRQAYDQHEARLDELTDLIEREQRHMDNERALAGHEVGSEEDRAGGQDSDAVRYERAFGAFLRRGIGGVLPEDRAVFEAGFSQDSELRAQSAGTTTTGGYAVPQGFWAKVTETLKAYGGILTVANILNTESGNPIVWPTVDDTGNVGAILAENTQVTGQDITFGQNTLGAYMYTSKLILASIQFLQDAGIDAEGFIARKIGQRLGRALAGHLATGSGTGQPQGLTQFATGKTGANGQTTSVILDDLIDLEHSIDVAYRQSGTCYFVMADSSVKVVRKLKDTTGRPLWEPSIQVGRPSTLNGYGVIVDNGMPAMAASAKSIAFGDIASGLVVRQVAGGTVMRLAERYADYLQVGFLGFGRFDARVDDSAAVRLYVNSAS